MTELQTVKLSDIKTAHEMDARNYDWRPQSMTVGEVLSGVIGSEKRAREIVAADKRHIDAMPKEQVIAAVETYESVYCNGIGLATLIADEKREAMLSNNSPLSGGLQWRKQLLFRYRDLTAKTA